MSRNTCSNNNNDVEINKLAKYRFLSKDIIDSKSDKPEYSQMKILENILNISISKIGLQSTKYDIRHEISCFKKSKDKTDYVKNLKNLNKSDISSYMSDISYEQITDDFMCRMNYIDNCKVENYSEGDLHEIYFQDPVELVPTG